MAKDSLRAFTGWMAWQGTIGYICKHHSPDAVLYLKATPFDDGSLMWSAGVEWGEVREYVEAASSLSLALMTLWKHVDERHRIFLSPEDFKRSPANYDEHDWLDLPTQDSLHRLIWTTRDVYQTGWKLVIMYQPIEEPQSRVEMVLSTPDDTPDLTVRGNTLLDACRRLFRDAAPHFVLYSQNLTTIALQDEDSHDSL
ncbi:MAG: hypothetical protein RLP44_05775 [Aggregatilineales bacterium]